MCAAGGGSDGGGVSEAAGATVGKCISVWPPRVWGGIPLPLPLPLDLELIPRNAEPLVVCLPFLQSMTCSKKLCSKLILHHKKKRESKDRHILVA